MSQAIVKFTLYVQREKKVTAIISSKPIQFDAYVKLKEETDLCISQKPELELCI